MSFFLGKHSRQVCAVIAEIKVEDWNTILRTLICPDCVIPMVPGLSVSLTHIEKVSRTFFYKVHLKRLCLLKERE